MVTISTAWLNAWIASWVWPFIRVLAFMNTSAVFDNKGVPRRVRIGLAALIAILLAQVLPSPPPLSDSNAMLVLIQQLLVGVTLGFATKLIFAGFEMAGDFMGLQMGLAFAQFIDPQRNSPSPLIGSFLGVLASLIFLSINGHLLALAALVKTFELIPVGSNLDIINPNRIALMGGMIFAIALQIALPVLAALLTANVVLGILTRAAPAMNIMSIGFAITILTGMWVLWMGLPYLSTVFEQVILRVFEVPIFKGLR